MYVRFCLDIRSSDGAPTSPFQPDDTTTPCTERWATEVPERHLLTARGNSWLQQRQRQRPLGSPHLSQVALNPTLSSLRPPHLHNPLRCFKQLIYIMLLCTGAVSVPQPNSCYKGSHHIMNSTLETAVSLIWIISPTFRWIVDLAPLIWNSKMHPPTPPRRFSVAFHRTIDWGKYINTSYLNTCCRRVRMWAFMTWMVGTFSAFFYVWCL